MFYTELRYFAENWRHVRYFFRKQLCRMCSVVLTPASTSDPLHDKLCVHWAVLLILHHQSVTSLHFLPVFLHSATRKPQCVPRCRDMEVTSLLAFTFSRKLSFLASSVLLGQGVPAANPVRAQSAAPGLSSLLPASPGGCSMS